MYSGVVSLLVVLVVLVTRENYSAGMWNARLEEEMSLMRVSTREYKPRAKINSLQNYRRF